MIITVFTQKETLYLGLVEGIRTAKPFWVGGVDSCLYGTVQVEEITIVDKDKNLHNYIKIDNGKTIKSTREEELFDYFINKIQ